jgi:hypothetical protein
LGQHANLHFLSRPLRLGGVRRGEKGEGASKEGVPVHYSITWYERERETE